MSCNNVLVSVVIPNYNGEKYLERCLNSIISQQYKNIEIIVVDDGSNDKSVEIVKKISNQHNKLILIEKDHCGPNLARKAGVSASKGKYIMFVDSDDYIKANTISKLVELFKRYKVDVIRFNYQKNKKEEKINFAAKEDIHEMVIGNEKIFELLLTTYKLNSLWCQIYKKDLLVIEDIFKNMKLGEDFVANLEIHKRTNRMLIYNGEPLYVYCDNPKSTTRTIDHSSIMGNISDRVKASCCALNIINDKKYNSIKERAVFVQLKMIRDYIMKLSNIANYNKQDFLEDIKSVIVKDSFHMIDEVNIDSVINSCGIINKMKYGNMVKSIFLGDYESMWKYFTRYKRMKRIRKVIW